MQAIIHAERSFIKKKDATLIICVSTHLLFLVHHYFGSCFFMIL